MAFPYNIPMICSGWPLVVLVVQRGKGSPPQENAARLFKQDKQEQPRSFPVVDRFPISCSCSLTFWRRRSRPIAMATATTSSPDFLEAGSEASSLLYQEQENLLIRQGELEGQLMSQMPSTPLQATVLKGIGRSGTSAGGGGFGGGSGGGGGNNRNGKRSSSTKASSAVITSKVGQQVRMAQAKAYAKVLLEDGVVRIDHVLSDDTANKVRSWAYARRQDVDEMVRLGQVSYNEHFADVLLKTNRCDMFIPIGSSLVANALSEVLLTSSVGTLLSLLLSDAAVLYEFSCLMSDPGSQRQVVHPDNPFDPTTSCASADDKGFLYTCFIALQDITLDMGPTTWIPRTHTRAMHTIFLQQEEDVAQGENANHRPKGKEWLLRTQPSVVGVLPKGSCAVFDSRILHCGGANESNQSRALLYFSFRNPKIRYPGNPGSIRSELTGRNQFTLKEMVDDLTRHVQGQPTIRITKE